MNSSIGSRRRFNSSLYWLWGGTLSMVIGSAASCGTGPTGVTASSSSSSGGLAQNGGNGGGGSGAGESGGAGGNGTAMGGAAGMGMGGTAGNGGAGGGQSAIIEPQGTSLFLEVYDHATGAPIADSLVIVGNDVRQTDAFGRVLFENLSPGEVVARILATGYVKTTIVTNLESGVHAGNTVRLLALGTAVSVNADQGGMVTKGNASVELPPGAFVNEAGQPVTGMVDAYIVPIDPTTAALDAMPGPLVGVTANGETGLISYFMADISFTQGGQQLQLAPGKEAILEFQLPDDAAAMTYSTEVIPAWWFDPTIGRWIEDGTGLVQESPTQPGKLIWRAPVRHFTTWNVDFKTYLYERNCYNVTVVNQANIPIPGNTIQSSGITYINGTLQKTTGADGRACIEAVMRRNSSSAFDQARIQSLSGGPQVTVTGQLPARTCPDAACIPITLQITTTCNPGAVQNCPYSGPAGAANNLPCKPGTKTCNAQGTGWSACTGEVLPQPTDLCSNSIDDNCNGTVNDGCVICTPNSSEACYTGPAGTVNVGICSPGMRQCNGAGSAWGPCMGQIVPNILGELCTTPTDDDCDGFTNENPPCVCTPLMPLSCYTGPAGTQGVGACASGTTLCNATGTGTGACNGEITPAAETCGNSTDEDCDGVLNESCASFADLFGNASNQYGTSVATNATGEIYLGGYFFGQINLGGATLSSPSAMTSDAFVAKLNAAGDTHIWSVRLGDVSGQPVDDQTIADIIVDNAGDLYVTGSYTRSIALGTNYTSTALDDGFVAKLNGSTGAVMWGVNLAASTAMSSVKPLSIAVGGDGSVVISGTFNGSFPCSPVTCSGSGDMFVRKLAQNNGSTVWSRVFAGMGEQAAQGVAADNVGNVIITGKTADALVLSGCPTLPIAGSDDAFLAKLDGVTGNCVWSRVYGDAFNQSGSSVAMAPNGDVVFAGNVQQGISVCGWNGVGNTTSDVFLARLNSNGACIWGRRILDSAGGPGAVPGDQEVADIRVDAMDNIALTGRFKGAMQWNPSGFGGGISNAGGSWDLFAAKFLGNGTFQWVRPVGEATFDQQGRAIAFGSTNSLVVVGDIQGTITLQGLMPTNYSSAGGFDVFLMRVLP